jgi:DNA-binding response OmpR family regulator
VERQVLQPLALFIAPECDSLEQINEILALGGVVLIAQSRDAGLQWFTEACLRGAHEMGSARVVLGDLELDLANYIADWKQHRLPLSLTEFRLLAVLATTPTKVWSHRELLKRVWETDGQYDTECVRSALKRLRRKLAAGDTGLSLETVRGVGVRLAVSQILASEPRADRPGAGV